MVIVITILCTWFPQEIKSGDIPALNWTRATRNASPFPPTYRPRSSSGAAERSSSSRCQNPAENSSVCSAHELSVIVCLFRRDQNTGSGMNWDQLNISSWSPLCPRIRTLPSRGATDASMCSAARGTGAWVPRWRWRRAIRSAPDSDGCTVTINLHHGLYSSIYIISISNRPSLSIVKILDILQVIVSSFSLMYMSTYIYCICISISAWLQLLTF